MGDPDAERSDSPCCKVRRIADAYDLEMDAELVELHESGASMRELARFLNTAIIEAAIDAQDGRIVADPEGIYDVLTGDEVSPERTVRVEDALQSAGIDVDDLESDLVSHVTVWNHVKEHLARETSRETMVDLETARSAIDAAREREETLISNTVDRLAEHPDVAGGDVDLAFSIRVFCRACGASYRLDEYLDAGGCDCQAEE